MTDRNQAEKRILVGICGGIAAYKSAELVRRLRDRGAQVRVVMTPAATEFIGPLTLQAVSGNPVGLTLFDPAAEAAMGHIDLARWADEIVIAPASADFIARLRGGAANDLLSTLCLASRAPITLAPAMNQQMWAAPATQDNIACLRQRAVRFLGPADGLQACGDVGSGRMLEPDDIVAGLMPAPWLHGRRILISAGPTREALDPVRFISNHSSGRMGFALAAAAADAGAQVTLISGPVTLATPHAVHRVDVDTALQMSAAVNAALPDQDAFFSVAAVGDYRAASVAEQKIKKTGDTHTLTLQLVQNPDIVAEAAAHPQRPPVVVAFAAETEQLERHAQDKLARKKVDFIAANSVAKNNSAFAAEDNQLILFDRDGKRHASQRLDKYTLSQWLLQSTLNDTANHDLRN